MLYTYTKALSWVLQPKLFFHILKSVVLVSYYFFYFIIAYYSHSQMENFVLHKNLNNDY